ncbi:MAG: endopeptidase La [Parachlamydiaceae bacterium]|nr:endopeptidase La [Parachlamydiaceae bacterium]
MDSLDETIKSQTIPPNQIHIFPLIRRPFFPGMAAPIMVEPGPFYDVLKAVAKSDDKYLGLVLAKSEQLDVYKATLGDLHPVGVLGRILRVIPMEQGGAQVILNMEKRLTIVGPADETKFKHLAAEVTYYEDKNKLTAELKAYAVSIISTIKELLKLNPLFKEELQIFLGHSDFTDPGRLADFAVALTTASREELQEILKTFKLTTRIEKSLKLLKKELDVSVLQNNINKKIDATIAKTQKDFFLREQLRTIKKELGIEREDKSLDREKFETRLKQRTVPEDVMKVITEEMDKLSVLETQSAEYGVCRNYLDWLTNIPWGIYDTESHNLEQAKAVLEEDHYGLEEIKQRVLEFMAVGKLSGSVKGSILCLVGPPGVGKTSVGKSIARALNRKFYRFSVGGMRDEAEIKGHRRTYIGAMPGKLIQALKFCQVMNPVIMLDEVDKMGVSFHGDPASALLEVLDPEQNSSFLDHYLDVRCNLSDILFIVTANVLDTIPEPLKDRMDIMRLSGYVMEEKVEIAKRYLIPRHRTEMGLKPSDVDFSKPGLRAIINEYAREAGVRTLENQVKKILRKVAVKMVSAQETSTKKSKATPKHVPIVVKPESLNEYLGKPVFFTDRFYERTPAGVCMGLAWTSHGGATLYIEAIKVEAEKTAMKLTGQAGSVMKESSEIAWSYLHGAVKQYAPNQTFFKNSHVHIHIPEGATPKDGPSAGITMVTALLSLLLNKPIKDNLGMTGELTLTGCVLPVGGIKEKFIAARRAGLKSVIMPKANARDYEELPDYIREGIEVHFVQHYEDVFPIAFSHKTASKKLGKKSKK